MTFEAVLFDLDDTLHDDSATYRNAARDVALEVAAEYGVDAGQLAGAYVAAADRFWMTLTEDRIATSMAQLRNDMWLEALRSVGLDNPGLAGLCAGAYNRARREHLRIWPEVPALLERLRGAGCKLGLITNGVAETHREKIALLDLEAAFDVILIADEVGMVKPDPRMFLHACRQLGAEPARCVMVGDRYERDVLGALGAGIRAVWLNVRREALPPGSEPPDCTIFTIAELEGALGAL
jgi:putative hydrolase of the HAD superfamily